MIDADPTGHPQEPTLMYQPTYQPQQQTMPPMDRLAYPKIPLNPGYPVQLQLPIPVPQSLQQVYPHIVYHAILAIQAEAEQNQLRCLFFNTMAQNNYANQYFVEFMMKLMELVEMMLLCSPNTHPEQVISTAAVTYTQFKVCQQLWAYPGLAVNFPPQMQQACEKGVNDFLASIASMEQLMNANQRGAYGGMQPQGGMSGLPMGAAPMGAGMPGSTMGARFGMPPPTVPGLGLSRFGVSSDRFTRNMPNAKAPQGPAAGMYDANGHYIAQRAAPPAPAPAPVAPVNWRAGGPLGTPAGAKSITPPLSMVQHGTVPPALEVVSIHSPTSAPYNNSIGVTELSSAPRIAAPAVQAIQATAAAPAPAPVPVVQLAVPVPKVAYDPNLLSSAKLVESAGVVTAHFQEKPNMDRELHLGRPNHAPSWLKAPTRAEFEQRLTTAQAAEPAGPTIELIELNPDSLTPSPDQVEPWARASVAISSARKRPGKINVATVGAMVIKPMPVTKSFNEFLDQVLKQKDLRQIGLLLKGAIEVFEGDDLLAAVEMDKRLTSRFNRFIYNQLALPAGGMGSFHEDISELLSWLPERFGPSMSKIIDEHAPGLVLDALVHVGPNHKETLENFMGTYFDGDLPENKDEWPNVVFFGEEVLLAVADLTSIELKLEIPEGKTSSMLMASSAPFAYEVISAVMGSKLMDKVTAVRMRTLDGVTIQLDQGGINPEAIMVSVAR